MEGHGNLVFSMPMFRAWVPEKVRPLVYLAFAVIFQLTGGVYLGSLAHMRGEMSLLQEDIMMCGYAGFIGLTMPFPLLFRLKFRFHNRQMLTLCAAMIILCNMVTLYTESLPVLWAVCFLAGWFKLWGTFECFSNIQLWMAPGRDFFRFFPLLYIVILSGIECSGIMSELCCYYLTWEYAPVIIISLLTAVILLLQLLTVNFRPGRPLPLYGIDWTGLVLWSLLLMELSFIFLYGEHYNWLDGMPIRYTLAASAVTGFFCIGRMRKVRHPYIEVTSWKYSNLAPAFIIFLFICIISSSSTVLESAFSGAVVPLGRLTIAGMAAMTLYIFMMFFLISPETPQSRLWLPAFIRQFGYAIIFTSLTLYIQVQMPFQHFFQGLCIIGMARTVLGGAVGGAVYGYLMRYNMADQAAILGAAADATALYGMDVAAAYPQLMLQALMVSVKNLFGFTFIVSCAFLLLMMCFDAPVRRRYVSMPDWTTVRKYVSLSWRKGTAHV